jgi:gliding motility-associated-like protein
MRFPALIIILIFLLFTESLCSQDIKRTNTWYFGRHAGVDFNSGEGVALYDGKMYDPTYRGNTTMSDTNGNLLFYTNGWHIWNSNHAMIDPQFMGRANQVVSFPVHGSNHLYYVFSTPYYNSHLNYYLTKYGIIDMSMNGGLGGVSGDFVTLDAAWDAAEKITAVKHKNKQDVWVITRKYAENKYASFLVSQDGVNTSPVLSPAPGWNPDWIARYGQMKISYDKKYLISCSAGSSWPENSDWIEVCKFDDESGEVDYLYYLQFRDPNLPYELWPYGVEFSPDSKFLYISFDHGNPACNGSIYQFDVQLIEDSALFVQSAVQIGIGGRRDGLQLASDGKIYVAGHRSSPTWGFPWLGVIHKPWEQGVNCQYQYEGVFLEPGRTTAALPNFLLDYLYRFDFEGSCEGEPFQFISFFHPEPANIIWDFGDPASGNNTSIALNPEHVFSDGGTYEVSVHIEYPNGRIEETSRKVEVEYKPEPDLGPDTSICIGEEIVLDAECGPYLYSWSTGAFGTSQITVSDTGWYWVRVENDAGCIEFDSIHIAFHPQANADTTNLEIIPTTCGGSTGVIKGLVISGNPPFIYQWLDDLGNPIGNTINIFHLAVGNYTLQVIDSNNCTTAFGPYSIFDAGEVLIENVEYTPEHCDQQNGSIVVTATAGLSDMLFYSIDNGASYYTNQGVFTGLSAGSYAVRVKDSSDCQDVYINNPVIIQNIDAPEIIDVQIGVSSVGQNNGSIEITASGGSDTIFYSNDNGANFQINDGGFYNLAAGFYTCVVMDEFGCDTTFIVEVLEEVSIRLQAVAGDDEVCPGNSAFVPLFVSNFNDVAYFKTTLLYNKDLLTCSGFANTHGLLEDSLEALLFPAEGRIELNWSSIAITLPDNTPLTDLVFESIDPGMSLVEWDGSAGASLFQNSTGLAIPVDYFTGNVKIYKEVSLSLNSTATACQGDTLKLVPMVWSSNGDVTFLWTYPNGDTSSVVILYINNIQANQSGIYSLRVTDTVDCQADASIDVLVYPTPVPEFAGQDTIITEEPVEINAGANYATYLWNTGESTQWITASYDGWYGVIIESQQGCMGEDSVYVLFFIPPEPPEPIVENFYIPNSFSPDGDGLNDEFKAISNSDKVSSFRMYIFNRWGALVFESNDISLGWDGKYKGKPAPQGVYAYKIEYSIGASGQEESRLKSGTVMLVR